MPRKINLDSSSDTLDLAYFTEQVQMQNYIPFNGSVNYTQNTPEPTVQEFDSGAKLVVRNGKPELVFDYIKGKIWDGIAHSYNTNNKDAVFLTFDNGAILVANNNGILNGFNLQMQNAASFMFKTGSEVARTQITIQLKDENTFNNDFAIITADQLGFDIEDELPEVMEVNLVADAPAAGANLEVAATARVNQGSNILGLGATEFRLIVDGSAATISTVTYNDVSNKYVIEPSSAFTAGQEVYAELYDTANSRAVANLDGQLYKGTSNTVTVTA